ncbi:MAG: isochorismatase family protein [Anaerolineaceae bacterium]|nr:isochorismatase family protein [Anaerolineaceae bacterium]
MNPALLVIDVQTAFFNDPVTLGSLARASWYINTAIAIFREKNLPVICIQHMNPEEGFGPESEGFGVHKDIPILDTDTHILKTYGNAFNKTNLDKTLRDMGIDTLIIVGFKAEGCVLSTYRGAKDMDYVPILLRGSIISRNPEYEKFVEDISDLITITALIKIMS